MSRDSTGLETTTTSLRIVDVIRDLDGARLREIADRLELADSTAHAHLQTLREQEYVVKEGPEYQLGLKLFRLGRQAKNRKPEYDVARRKAHELCAEVNEEVSFAVEEHGRSIILFDEIDDPSKEGFQVGRRFYMHASASGKAMLAEFDRERVEAIIERWGLPARTDRTITDRAALFEELERTRERGYSLNDQEALDGLKAVGVAIRNPDGSVFGSLDVSGPPYRIEADDLVDRLWETRAAIEEEIEAHRAPGPPDAAGDGPRDPAADGPGGGDG